MAYTTPTTQSTGTLITATIWNTDIVNNVIALRTGAIALTSQATGDVIYASSSTQLGRVAIGTTGYVLTSNGSAPAWSNTPTLTGTNITGVPISTGISGLGTGVATFLATPSSANLASAVTDETGSGALVFATSPTLVTPVLGAASGTSLSLAGALSGVTTLAASGVVTLSDTTDASSSTTGALKVAGGLGVAKKLYVGTNFAAGGLLTVSGFGTHTFSAGGAGGQFLNVRNTSAGTGNYAGIAIGNDTADTGLVMYLVSSNNTFGGMYVANGAVIKNVQSGGMSFGAEHASGEIRFYAGGSTQRVSITSGGQLSAGDDFANKTEATAQFIVNGSGYGLYQWLDATAAYIGQNSTLRELRMYSGTSPTTGVKLTNGATSWASTSDERLKTTLTPFPDAAATLRAVRTGTGRYLTDDSSVSRSFFLAQDWVTGLPEAVTRDDEGTLSLRYTDTLPLIVAGWQQHDTQLTALTDTITAQHARIATLEAQIAALLAAQS